MRVRFPSRENPLEEGMATHSSILAWRRIPWTEEPGGLPAMRSQRVLQDRATNTHTHNQILIKFLLTSACSGILQRAPKSWDNPSQADTGVGCHSLLQGIFQTQGWNPGLPHFRRILFHLSHQRSSAHWVAYQGNLHQIWEWAFLSSRDEMVMKYPQS